MSGREYFAQLAREEKIETLNAAEITELPPLKLKRGKAESRVGGNLGSRDLITLTPEQTCSQHEKADKLVSLPRRRFPAEERDES